jgi:type II secretory pathway pseudopilin PulG
VLGVAEEPVRSAPAFLKLGRHFADELATSNPHGSWMPATTNTTFDNTRSSASAARAFATIAQIRDRLRAQAGFTLVEQLVAFVALGLVVGATLTVLNSLMRAAPVDQEWGHTIANTQAGMYTMTRELRQGTNVTLVTGYVMSADVLVNGATQHVLYQCDLGNYCTRKSTTAPTAAPSRGAGGTTLMSNVENNALGTVVFTSPASKYYQLQVIVRSAGALKTAHTHNVTLTDGFFARNT